MWLAKCKQLGAKLRGSYNLSGSIPSLWPGLMSLLIAILMRFPGHPVLHVLFTNHQDRILDNFIMAHHFKMNVIENWLKKYGNLLSDWTHCKNFNLSFLIIITMGPNLKLIISWQSWPYETELSKDFILVSFTTVWKFSILGKLVLAEFYSASSQSSVMETKVVVDLLSFPRFHHPTNWTHIRLP